MLTVQSLPAIQLALREADLDGWLLYDFHGLNPIACGLLGLSGMDTRRVFVLIRGEGAPVALTHAIEQGPWLKWPSQWDKKVYSGWRTLESAIAELAGGRRVAMEYSPGDAVPYLDRIPAGVLEMVRSAGATVVSSADLVSRFYAVWTADNIASHTRAAEAIAIIAHDAMQRAGEAASNGSPLTEYALQQWILEQFNAQGFSTDHGPIVAIGPNAANPHYEPSAEGTAVINSGDILLIDLWAREDGGVYADQTWVGSLGAPSERSAAVWSAVRDGRDAALAMLHECINAGTPVSGGEVDDAARDLISTRGFGDKFIHRTGHSIDARDLHGSGPHIDNLETREERMLIRGVGFSIEPGVYIDGEVGMRSEVNGIVGDGELIVTPAKYQRDLIVV